RRAHARRPARRRPAARGGAPPPAAVALPRRPPAARIGSRHMVVDLPPAFSAVLPQVERTAHIAVRLPARADLDIGRRQQLYATGAAKRTSYDLELATTSRCGGANACFLAAFTARRGKSLGERTNVRLA